MSVRVSLLGRVAIEADGVVVDEQRLQGRQGRVLLAFLVTARGRPVSRDELADALWGGNPPATWEKALSVLASKLRALLGECSTDGSTWLTSAFGCYQLSLPAGTWIDVEAAADAVAGSEQALIADDLDEARAGAAAALALARGTFLPGEEGDWVDERRAELRAVRVRALECLARASLLLDDSAAAVRAAEEVVTLEPFREQGYRLLMQAHSAAGNDAEALRTYERCRALIAEELGAFPSSETEAVYLEILRGTAGQTGAPDPSHTDAAGLPVPDPIDEPSRGSRRRARRLVLVVAVIAAAAVAVAGAVAWDDDAPPVVAPNSLVRIDLDSAEPTLVVPIGDAPDIVVASGGYVWITHHVLRDAEGIGGLRYAGKRILTRVDPSTGEATVVGGGLAPCGIVADPSGDVWVANCYLAVSGPNPAPTLVRLDAETLAFERTFRVPGGDGFFRGLAFGGGWLWASDIRGGDVPETGHAVTRIDPSSGVQRRIPLVDPSGPVAWSGEHGDLWLSNFPVGTVSRLDAATGDVETTTPPISGPSFVTVAGDDAWIANWNGPQIVRMRHTSFQRPRVVELPTRSHSAGVWWVTFGAGSVWATTPRDGALWRIDPRTEATTRIDIPYLPTGVAVDDDAVWVTVRPR